MLGEVREVETFCSPQYCELSPLRFKDDENCCPTCPNLCKQWAAQEKTYTNSSLDCASFNDPSCYFSCPDQCSQAARRGESRNTPDTSQT